MPLTQQTLHVENSRRLGAAGLKAFFRLADLWKLNTEEQMGLLGYPKRSTFFEWKKNPNRQLMADTLERLSYLIGIFKALGILFPDPTIADGWVRNHVRMPPFGGRTPLDVMLKGGVAALYETREFLDAWRGAW